MLSNDLGKKSLCYDKPSRLLCYNKSRQGFVLRRSLALLYYDRGSAHPDSKNSDNLENRGKLIKRTI